VSLTLTNPFEKYYSHEVREELKRILGGPTQSMKGKEVEVENQMIGFV